MANKKWFDVIELENSYQVVLEKETNGRKVVFSDYVEISNNQAFSYPERIRMAKGKVKNKFELEWYYLRTLKEKSEVY